MDERKEKANADKYIGVRWKNLTVTGYGKEPSAIACLCGCGNTVEVPFAIFKAGKVTSCGCKRSLPMDEEAAMEKLWKSAGGMLARHRESTKSGRAAVCADWRESKVLFVDWAMKNGYKAGLVLHRDDRDKPFSPQNCRWVLPPHKSGQFTGCVGTLTDLRRDDWVDDAPHDGGGLRVPISGGRRRETDIIRQAARIETDLPDQCADVVRMSAMTPQEISKWFLEV